MGSARLLLTTTHRFLPLISAFHCIRTMCTEHTTHIPLDYLKDFANRLDPNCLYATILLILLVKILCYFCCKMVKPDYEGKFTFSHYFR